MARQEPPGDTRGRKGFGDQARETFVTALIESGGKVMEACQRAGVKRGTYQGWRKHHFEFRVRVDRIVEEFKQAGVREAMTKNLFDPNRTPMPVPGFEEFRRTYIGRPVADHQKDIVRAYEDKTNLVVIILGPAGSGKDTTAGDLVLHAAAEKRQRVAWIMESTEFSARRLGRLYPYLTDLRTYDVAPAGPGCTVPTRNMIEDFGPFKWNKEMRFPDDSKVPSRSWTQHSAYFLGVGDQEADPNLWATGVGGALYGSRIDLLVLSDPFTAENQQSPALRASQLTWVNGTLMTRLDEGGRLIVLGTRVSPHDNYGVLLDQLIGEARPLIQDGYYTKYSNGVATVIYPAIEYDENGVESSYWPERFPLYAILKEKDGTTHLVSDLPDEQYVHLAKSGAEYVRGLDDFRTRDPDLFETMMQQNPPDKAGGEFTDALLNHCDDPTRSFGMYRPGDGPLILGVDPARTGGAAWFLWQWNRDTGEKHLIDYFFGTRLGTMGLREQLLVKPLQEFWPTWLVYESNRETSVLEHPDVMDAVDKSRTQVHRHFTSGANRNKGAEFGVSMMAFDMRDGLIKWPAATVADRKRLELVKEHFRNWDRKQTAKGPNSGALSRSSPDDIAMAGWVGWVKIKELEKATGGGNVVRRKLSVATMRRMGQQPDVDVPRPAPVTDLADAYFEGLHAGP
jgi:hypothetical protein